MRRTRTRRKIRKKANSLSHDILQAGNRIVSSRQIHPADGRDFLISKRFGFVWPESPRVGFCDSGNWSCRPQARRPLSETAGTAVLLSANGTHFRVHTRGENRTRGGRRHRSCFPSSLRQSLKALRSGAVEWLKRVSGKQGIPSPQVTVPREAGPPARRPCCGCYTRRRRRARGRCRRHCGGLGPRPRPVK